MVCPLNRDMLPLSVQKGPKTSHISEVCGHNHILTLVRISCPVFDILYHSERITSFPRNAPSASLCKKPIRLVAGSSSSLFGLCMFVCLLGI